jgi:rhamnosyltransferase
LKAGIHIDICGFMIEKQSNLVKMKLGAVVILYNPDEELKYNINSYLSKVELLLVLDNSVSDKAKALFEGNPKIQYYWDGENRGISYRLNQALKICREKNIIYLLTMDQDSSFDPTMLDKYLHQIEKCPVLENVGMFGINLDKNDKNDYYDELFITSGSIINVDLAQQIGDFDEKLFIDEVDNEFCLRLILNKYSTLKFGNITMNHQFGSTRKVLTPSLTYKERVIYSPLRNYYNTRNYFYVNKLYKHDYKQKKDRKTMLLYRIKNSLLYENYKGIQRFYV